jgi:hypothetical protein
VPGRLNVTCTFMIFRNIDYRANSLNHSQTLRQVTTAYYTVTGGTSLVCRCPTNTRVHEQVLRLVVSLNDQQYEGLGLPVAVHQPVITCHGAVLKWSGLFDQVCPLSATCNTTTCAEAINSVTNDMLACWEGGLQVLTMLVSLLVA